MQLKQKIVSNLVFRDLVSKNIENIFGVLVLEDITFAAIVKER